MTDLKQSKYQDLTDISYTPQIGIHYFCKMGKNNNIEDFLLALKKRLKKEMPRIKKEIKLYERKLELGQLDTSPTPAPQFHE